jgi:hypothetical protein
VLLVKKKSVIDQIEAWRRVVEQRPNPSDCKHEDAVSQDDGYMYCPDCNESFKECD